MEKKKTEWWYVYRGINQDKKEVYFGVSQDPDGRKDGSHCVGGTVALQHWKCERHSIRWSKQVSKHLTQKKASEVAHGLVKSYKHPKGFKNSVTAGI